MKAQSGNPAVVVIAGPNGAGKTTAAPDLLTGALCVSEFVNADTIAQGLSGFSPENSALEAGKVLLKHIRMLASRGSSFAFETTLASRSFAPWLQTLKDRYSIHIVFLWLATADLAVQRVNDRVAMGGHSIPENVIRRRYDRGIGNFFKLYMPLCSSWRFYDNSADFDPDLIARGEDRSTAEVLKTAQWQAITERWDNV